MTYSIVARDPETSELGIAVQSHYLSVGHVVPWAASGVGAVATQSFAQPSYGPLGLALMGAGIGAADALRALTAADADEDRRQVACVDAGGAAAAHTGARCIPEAGDRQGEGFSVQANMMLRATVPDAMADSFAASKGLLARRLLDALDAAEAEGGDIRGRQSAAILVVRGETTGRPWEDRTVEMRVEDHPEPLVELRRLVELRLAYRRANDAGEQLARGDAEGAFAELAAALADAPDDRNLVFGALLTHAGAGRIHEATALARRLGAVHDGWSELIARLPGVGLIPDDPAILEQLLGPGA
jgi:uncharacterized Ntn-hydrolase superfamily protein